jgi:DHA2 family multidrug resistance protein
LLVLFVGALEIALQRAAAAGSSGLSEIAAELAMASLASLILTCHLRKAPHPVIRIGVFRDTNFAVAILINVAVGIVFFGTITLVPALVQGPLGRDALLAGLVMAPRGMATLAGMAVMGRVATRANARLLLFLGLTVTSIALLMMALPSTQTDVGWLAFASFLQGVGAGVLFTPLSVLAFSTLPAAARTEASGCYNLIRQIGSACGVAIVSGIISSTNLADSILPLTEIDSPQPLPASAGGYSTALVLLAGIMLAVTPLVPFFNAPRRARAAATLADAVPPGDSAASEP